MVYIVNMLTNYLFRACGKTKKKLKWPRNKNTALVTRDTRSYKSKVHPHLKHLGILRQQCLHTLVFLVWESVDHSLDPLTRA